MTPSGEPDLFTAFHRNGVVIFYSTAHHMHHCNFITGRNYQVKPWRMESNRLCLITRQQSSFNLKLPGSVVPDLNIVFATGNNELLP
jgi:hypothetical protein